MVAHSGSDDDRVITHVPLPMGLFDGQAATKEVPVIVDERDGSTVYVRPVTPLPRVSLLPPGLLRKVS
jgi:hypothetical protein